MATHTPGHSLTAAAGAAAAAAAPARVATGRASRAGSTCAGARSAGSAWTRWTTSTTRTPTMLKTFILDRGKVIPRRMTGTCARHQRWLKVAIKRARNIALLPFAAGA